MYPSLRQFFKMFARASLCSLISAISLSFEIMGQELVPNCDGQFQRCGYVLKGTKVWHIPPRFEVAERFHHGLAAVRLDGKYGYINIHGKFAIEPRFELAGPFSNNYAEVRLKRGTGIINRDGEIVVPARFRRIIPFVGNVFIAEPYNNTNTRSGFPGNRLTGLTDLSPLPHLSNAGLYDLESGWFTSPDFEFHLFDTPDSGLVWARRKGAHNYMKWGLMKSDGKWQVVPSFSGVQQLSEGRAIVQSMPDMTLSAKDRKKSIFWGAVDQKGKIVVPLVFEHLSAWRGGIAIAKKSLYSGSDSKGRKILEALVRTDGSLLGGSYFDQVDRLVDARLSRAKVDETWFSITPDGELIEDRLGCLDLHWRCGVEVPSTSVVAENPKSIDPLICEGGLRFYEEDGFWGLVDNKGDVVINASFRALSCFHGGISWGARERQRAWCPIDGKGQRVKGIRCRTTYYLIELSHYYPEKLDNDPFESSVIWNRNLLEFFAGTRPKPPKLVGDGIRGQGVIPVPIRK